MKEHSVFPESELERLRGSLLALGVMSKRLQLDDRLESALDQLYLQLPVSIDSSPTQWTAQAPHLITEAKSSVRILEAEGLLDVQAEGLASRLRFTLDELETALGRNLRKEPAGRVCGLYVIIDPQVTMGRDPLEVARGALRGGTKMIQLRDKLGEKGRTIVMARELKQLCDEFAALLIINDHADLAALVGAHGLHVGQGDLPAPEARRLLDPVQLIGRSNYTLAESLESQSQGADYVAVGNVYPTSTKASIRARTPTGPELLCQVKEDVGVPLVAIGGINEENIEQVARTGADAICVTSAVGLSPEPENAARRLVEIINSAGGNT